MITAYLFDLDGTLVDSMTDGWVKMLREFVTSKGGTFTPDLVKDLIALGLQGGGAFFKKEFGLQESVDEIVAELYQTRKVKKILKGLFPNAVNGLMFLKVDRNAIAKEVFSDKAKHIALTDAITPLVLEEIKKRTQKIVGACFVEVPLLFECNYQSFFNGVWVIVRSLEQRIASVETRSNLTREQVLARIKNQVDYDAIDLSPYTVIKNDGSKQDLENAINDLLKNI